MVVYSYNYIKLSSAVGWIYTLTWSISFWPQIIKNFQRKSVVGLNFDFVGLSLLGQTLYGSFNYGLYFSGYIEVSEDSILYHCHCHTMSLDWHIEQSIIEFIFMIFLSSFFIYLFIYLVRISSVDGIFASTSQRPNSSENQ